jgi:hypothetical protein
MLRKLISEHSLSLRQCTRGSRHSVVDMSYENETEGMRTHLQRDAAQEGVEEEDT